MEERLSRRELARFATRIENRDAETLAQLDTMPDGRGLSIGITGPPGAGKSTLVDSIITELRAAGQTVAIIAVDPSSNYTGGAILGDRVRMQRHHADGGVFIRSLGTRGATGGIAEAADDLKKLFLGAGFDLVILETVGVGQDQVAVKWVADVTVLVLAPGMGDDIQAIKAGLMEMADVFVINKADFPTADAAEASVREMLSMETEGFHRPIFRTVATEGTGVAELVHTLRQSRKPARWTFRSLWSLDHLGIAVPSIDESLRFYQEQLGMAVASRETVEQEKVHVAMLPAGDARIELLEPSTEDSVIATFLKKRGPGLHHVAMTVPDLRSVIRRLETAGCRLLNQPRHGAGGHLYVFVHPASTGGVLWELIQK